VRDVEKKELPEIKSFETKDVFAQLVPHADREFPVFAWKPGPSKVEFPEVFDRENFSLRQRDLMPTSWRLEGATGLSLLDRIRKSGTPLGEYVKHRWYWGIKTGFNEAFCVNSETHDRLVAEHKSSAEVLRPLLRGRDVKRWRCDYAEQYLIKIASSENTTHPWSSKTGKEAETAFAKTFPAIHRFFNEDDHRAKLINRTDQGRFFWELRSCAYWQEFEQPKIIVPAISGTVNVAVDTDGYFANNKASIFVSPEARFLAAVVNSPVAFWFTTQVFSTKQGGFWDFEPRYSSQWPIPAATPEQKALCEALSGALIELHQPQTASLPERGLIVSWFEQWLNGLVYELFFPGELHARGLHLFAETAQLLPDGKLLRKSIPEIFAASRDFKRPLRAMLTDLQTIEEVRLIESAGK
jgi:adenine-specific DNA-methyltransferase